MFHKALTHGSTFALAVAALLAAAEADPLGKGRRTGFRGKGFHGAAQLAQIFCRLKRSERRGTGSGAYPLQNTR